MWNLSSLTRDWTWTSCIRRWSLNHWTIRKFPQSKFLLTYNTHAFLCVYFSVKQLEIELPYDPAISLLGIHTKETRTERDTCTPMFIAALFIIARTWKQPRCPSADEWIRKLWYIYTMEYYSAIKYLCPDGITHFLFFSFIFISWRLITLQYCSGFCHTLTWISHGFTCVPHPEPPSHLPLDPIPLGLPSAPAPSTCLMNPTWTGDLFHIW